MGTLGLADLTRLTSGLYACPPIMSARDLSIMLLPLACPLPCTPPAICRGPYLQAVLQHRLCCTLAHKSRAQTLQARRCLCE